MRSPPTRTLAAALLAAMGLLLSTSVHAATRALLIGVGDYPNLPQRLHLAAPAGDVERLSGALVGAGLDPKAVQTLTGRSGPRPTRDVILARLRAMAAEAQTGDQILVYFSGHGAQAPARYPAREPDGLEELYLAADASGWDGETGSVPGSVADFELEAALAAIRAKGAAVWFVADACHAAGLTRSGAEGRVKSVSAADLGIPAARSRERGRERDRTPVGYGAEPGAFTGFYAAAPGALAVERLLPAGAPDARASSTFTYALVRALNQGRYRSLRDLALAASAASAETGPGAPAPVFEGALNADVLGLSPHARSFPVRRVNGELRIEAGALEGFTAGAKVELRAASGARANARVETAGPLSALLAASGELPGGALTASLSNVAVSGAGAASRGERLLTALAPLAGDGGAGLSVVARLWRGGCGANPPARDGFPAASESFDLWAPAPLHHCDVIYLEFRNESAAAIDVTPLYVDASGAIIGLTLSDGDSVRLAPAQSRFAAVRLLTRDVSGRRLAAGVERLAVLSAPASARDPLDLRSLAGSAILRGGETLPSGPALNARIFALTVE
ncbi:MAG: caspase family protein [Caulobacteraceae bacterium]